MNIPVFILSETDRSLVYEGRRVDHPLVCAPLLAKLPPDIGRMDVVAAYDVNADDPRGRGSCAQCGRKQNHLHGLVLRARDGSCAAIGRTCCLNKHDLKYEQLIKEFDEGTQRGHALEHVMAAIKLLPDVHHIIQNLKELPQIAGLQKVRSDFETRFNRIYGGLQAARGRLVVTEEADDDERMNARKGRREKKANRYRNRFLEDNGREPSRAEVDAHHFDDPDFSTERLKKQIEKQIGVFSAGLFFTKLRRIDSEFTSLEGRLERALAPFDNTSSDKLSTSAIQARLGEFKRVVRDVMALIDGLNEAGAFFQPGNLMGIIRWANRRSDLRIGGTYDLEPGALLCRYSDGPSRKLSFPELFPQISNRPLAKILAAVQGTMSDEDSIDNAQVA